MASIEHLPDEIMMEIFSFLSPKELSYAAQVCHRWKMLCEDESFWHKINLINNKRFLFVAVKCLSRFAAQM